jgi:hypothetical protein
VQAERCDGFGQVMRFGRSDDRSADDGVAEHPCQRDLAMLMPRVSATCWTALTTGSSWGESKDLTISSTVERWDCSPHGRVRRPLPCGE